MAGRESAYGLGDLVVGDAAGFLYGLAHGYLGYLGAYGDRGRAAVGLVFDVGQAAVFYEKDVVLGGGWIQGPS